MEVMGFKKTDEREHEELTMPCKYFDLLDMARDEGCVDRTFETKVKAKSFINNLRNAALGRYNRLHKNDGFKICASLRANRVFVYRVDIDG